MINKKNEAQYNENFIKYIKPKKIEPTNDNKLLIKTLKRINKGEIKLQPHVSVTPTKYKSVIAEYQKNNNFITDFVNSIASVEVKVPFNAYRRLFLKMVHLTPIKTRDIIYLKNSDFVVDGDYCLVKNKYLLFIPLFAEAKGIPKDDRLFMWGMLMKGIKKDTEINRKQAVSVFSIRAMKELGYFGYDRAQMRLHFFLYLTGLDLHDLAKAMTLISMATGTKHKLGFI